MSPDCPADLLTLPADAVYRETTKRGQCRWIDCDLASSHGLYCPTHRRWHGQRLLHQLEVASGGSS